MSLTRKELVFFLVALASIVILLSISLRGRPKTTPTIPASSVNTVVAVPTDKTGRIVPNPALGLLAGYDSLNAEPKGACVERRKQDAKLHAPAVGQSGGLTGELIRDRSYVANTSSVSGAASVGLGIFSADASMSYVDSGSVNQYADYFRVSERVENAPAKYELADLQPTREARSLLDHRNLPAFLTMCGDQFVVGIITGGAFEELFQTIAKTTTEQTKLAGSLSGASFFGSMSVSGQNTLQSLIQNGQVTYKVLREGTADEWPTSDMAKLQEYANKFPTKVYCKPDDIGTDTCKATTIGYVMASYSDLDPRASLSAEGELGHIASYLRDLRIEIAGLSYIAAHPDEFGYGIGPFNPSAVSLELKRVSDARDEAYRIAQQCAAKHTRECTVSEIKLVPLPRRVDEYRDYQSMHYPPNAPILGNISGLTADLQYRAKLAFHLDPAVLSYVPLPLYVPSDEERVLVAEGSFWEGGKLQKADDGHILFQIKNNATGSSTCYRYRGPVIIPGDSSLAVGLDGPILPIGTPIGPEPMIFTYTPFQTSGVQNLNKANVVNCQ